MGSNAEIHLGDVYKISIQVVCKEGFEVNDRSTGDIIHEAVNLLIHNHSDWNITTTVNYNNEDTGVAEVQSSTGRMNERCCGTCLHGGKNYWKGECSLNINKPVEKDIDDWCGAWHRK